MKSSQLRILLVEDIAADAELCRSTLEKAGFSVQMDVCSDAQDFERFVGATDYDVILADYNLKNWNGLETIDIVRRVGKNIPVIVLTGHLGDEKAVEWHSVEAPADYVLKDRFAPASVCRPPGRRRQRVARAIPPPRRRVIQH